MTPAKILVGPSGFRFLHKLCPGRSIRDAPSMIGISRFFRHTYQISLTIINASLCIAAQKGRSQNPVAKLSNLMRGAVLKLEEHLLDPRESGGTRRLARKLGSHNMSWHRPPMNTKGRANLSALPFAQCTRFSVARAGSGNCAGHPTPQLVRWKTRRCHRAWLLSYWATHARCPCGNRCRSFRQ